MLSDPGYFGNALGQNTSHCSGSCTTGYFCPTGSSSATAIVCPVGTYRCVVGYPRTSPSAVGARVQVAVLPYSLAPFIRTSCNQFQCTDEFMAYDELTIVVDQRSFLPPGVAIGIFTIIHDIGMLLALGSIAYYAVLPVRRRARLVPRACTAPRLRRHQCFARGSVKPDRTAQQGPYQPPRCRAQRGTSAPQDLPTARRTPVRPVNTAWPPLLPVPLVPQASTATRRCCSPVSAPVHAPRDTTVRRALYRT